MTLSWVFAKQSRETKARLNSKVFFLLLLILSDFSLESYNKHLVLFLTRYPPNTEESAMYFSWLRAEMRKLFHTATPAAPSPELRPVVYMQPSSASAEEIEAIRALLTANGIDLDLSAGRIFLGTTQPISPASEGIPSGGSEETSPALETEIPHLSLDPIISHKEIPVVPASRESPIPNAESTAGGGSEVPNLGVSRTESCVSGDSSSIPASRNVSLRESSVPIVTRSLRRKASTVPETPRKLRTRKT